MVSFHVLVVYLPDLRFSILVSIAATTSIADLASASSQYSHSCRSHLPANSEYRSIFSS